MKQDKERQNLLARINELEQTLNNERTVGREKMLDELAEDYEKNFHFAEPSADYIRNWKPKEERYASR